MIKSFKDKGTEDIYNRYNTQESRKKCPVEIWGIAQRKLDILNIIKDLNDIKSPGFRLEKLKGDRIGEYSIRINDKYRICFIWEKGNVLNVEITNYHK